jgi:poly-gamma-glutamate capsule biosynthesis protein CapA/YwtB (metallophosphatase superfamily)
LASHDEITMLLVGDVYVRREDPPSIFAHVKDLLRSADITFGNLEAPITDRGEPLLGKPIAGVNFRSPLNAVDALTAAGFDAVGLANNHSMDWGPEGILQTIEVLDQAGIAHCGAGRNLEEAHQPVILERKGCRVAFLSYSSVYQPGAFPATADRAGIATVKVNTAYLPSTRVFEQPGSPGTTLTVPDPAAEQRLLNEVRAAKQQADIVVVSWHWGVSQSYGKLVNYQTDLGRAVIDAGADLVSGTHPHVVQAVEAYRHGYICYCLANFAFDHQSPHFGNESMIVKCQIADGKIARLSVLPVLLNEGGQPEVVDLDRGRSIIQSIERQSAEFGMVLDPAGDEVVVRAAQPR